MGVFLPTKTVVFFLSLLNIAISWMLYYWHSFCSTTDKLYVINCMNEKAHIEKIASEIKSYLDEHPYAADNIDGITGWWLLRQRLKEHRNNVEQALLLLLAKGCVRQQINDDGSQIYMSSKNHNSISNRK